MADLTNEPSRNEKQPEVLPENLGNVPINDPRFLRQLSEVFGGNPKEISSEPQTTSAPEGGNALFGPEFMKRAKQLA